MFDTLRLRQPGAPLWRIAWWYLLQSSCYVWMATCFRFRAWGLHHIPPKGPVLYLCNHQSYLDPIIVAVASHSRHPHALARSTLFRNPGFAWLIRSLNAFPVEQGEADMAAMRRSIEVLKKGHALLVFPEGTRTPDGTTKPFAAGIMLLIRRAKPLVVPVAVEGAYHAWPRDRRLPRPTGRVAVEIGKPIPPDQLIAMGSEAGLEHVRGLVEQMRQGLASRHAGIAAAPHQ